LCGFDTFSGGIVSAQRSIERIELGILARQIAEARVVVDDFRLREQQRRYLPVCSESAQK